MWEQQGAANTDKTPYSLAFASFVSGIHLCFSNVEFIFAIRLKKSLDFSISQMVTRQGFLRVVVSIKSDLLVQAATRQITRMC
jgi:hypothetical protein